MLAIGLALVLCATPPIARSLVGWFIGAPEETHSAVSVSSRGYEISLRLAL